METTKQEPVLDFRFRPAWEAGFDGEPCPTPPAWMEPVERGGWKAAWNRGRKSAGLPDQPAAVVFSAGYEHWRVATAETHKVTLGSWKTPGGAERAAERAGFDPVIHGAETAKAAIQSLKA